ncbi:hypothetical protein BDM02DRAFT_3096670, partial [Thelephora ganbajun]
GDADAQARWVRQLIWEVARHATGEDIVVYPLSEKRLSAEGRQLADQWPSASRGEPDTTLQRHMIGSHPRQGLIMNWVMDRLRPYDDSEGIADLPKLDAQLGGELSGRSVRSFALTKEFVPTSSALIQIHNTDPRIIRSGDPFLAGFLATPIDKLKDIFVKFPNEESLAVNDR